MKLLLNKTAINIILFKNNIQMNKCNIIYLSESKLVIIEFYQTTIQIKLNTFNKSIIAILKIKNWIHKI